jgi:hypothetical protein
MTELPDDMEAAELRLRDCLGEATEANVAVDTGDLRALLLAYKERGRALGEARGFVFDATLDDRYPDHAAEILSQIDAALNQKGKSHD